MRPAWGCVFPKKTEVSLAHTSPDKFIVLRELQDWATFSPTHEPLNRDPTPVPARCWPSLLVRDVVVPRLSTVGDHLDSGRASTSRALPKRASRANSLNVTISLVAASLQKSASWGRTLTIRITVRFGTLFRASTVFTFVIHYFNRIIWGLSTVCHYGVHS